MVSSNRADVEYADNVDVGKNYPQVDPATIQGKASSKDGKEILQTKYAGSPVTDFASRRRLESVLIRAKTVIS